jgi:hypothetical protein
MANIVDQALEAAQKEAARRTENQDRSTELEKIFIAYQQRAACEIIERRCKKLLKKNFRSTLGRKLGQYIGKVELKEINALNRGLNIGSIELLLPDIPGRLYFCHSGRADWLKLTCEKCGFISETSCLKEGRGQQAAELGLAIKAYESHLRDCPK